MTERHVRDLKPGDEVAIWFYRSGFRRATIDRVTKTQIVISTSRFNRDTGRVIGGTRGTYIEPLGRDE